MLTSNIRNMWAIKVTDISKIRVELEKDLLEAVNKAKAVSKVDAYMKFYNEKKPTIPRNTYIVSRPWG